MRDLNCSPSFSSFFLLNSSPSFLKKLFFFGSICLNFLESSPVEALPLTSSNSPKLSSLAAVQPTAMPLPEGLKPPSSELPSFNYKPEASDASPTDMKYNPEAKEAIRNDAQPL